VEFEGVMSVADTKTVYSVSQINELIKQRLESDERFIHCYVVGEISNFKHHSSGHMYFTLKDDKSRIQTVMFASRNRFLSFRAEDGMRVICFGSLGVFDRGGQYQLYVDEMQPDGIGALYIAFEQLRKQLADEGLFNEERKRKLPAFPSRVGVVTSPTGAVIRDICSTLARRYPMTKVILAPALVQGPEAAATIVEGLSRLQKLEPPPDVIIIGRGGGSLEELWPFNEEIVARAIAACTIPVVSAVGHETDFTISDYVADMRAATPTAAAELVAPHFQDLRQQLHQITQRAQASLRFKLNDANNRVASLENSVSLADPKRSLDRQRQAIDYLEGQLRQCISAPIASATKKVNRFNDRLHAIDFGRKIALLRMQLDRIERIVTERTVRQHQNEAASLDRLIASLEALNPLSVLRRGFSIVYGADGKKVIQSVNQVSNGDTVYLHLSDGRVPAIIKRKGGNSSDRSEGSDNQLRLDL
jgi:exodeoxyribonuclease VII large subunit